MVRSLLKKKKKKTRIELLRYRETNNERKSPPRVTTKILLLTIQTHTINVDGINLTVVRSIVLTHNGLKKQKKKMLDAYNTCSFFMYCIKLWS